MRRCLLAAVLVLLAVPQLAQAAGDRILFISVRADSGRELYAVDRDGGALQRLTFNDVHESGPAWSPDRTRIAFSGLRNGRWDIYTVAADGSDLRYVTNDTTRDNWPKWTSDGRIVFVRGELICPCRPWIANADGSGLAELPIPGNVFMLEPSPVNEKVVYTTDRHGSWSLHVSRLNGRADRRVTRGTGPGDFNARWAPDGVHIAFLRGSEAGDNDVFVVRSSGKKLQRLTSTPGRVEFFPAWSSDGSEVLFGDDSGDLHAVSLAGGGETALSTAPRAPFLEDFGDGRRDASLWHQAVTGTGVSIGEAGGRLEIDFAGPQQSVGAHYGLQCQLTGDFDLQVDYELLDWPAVNGIQAYLAGFTPSTSAQIFRESKPWGENYGWWIDPAGGGTPTMHSAGSMRMTRTNGVVTTFYASGATWIALGSGARPEPLTAAVGAGDFQTLSGLRVRLAYDNFRINSGELTCPSSWSDLAPDVAFDRSSVSVADADE